MAPSVATQHPPASAQEPSARPSLSVPEVVVANTGCASSDSGVDSLSVVDTQKMKLSPDSSHRRRSAGASTAASDADSAGGNSKADSSSDGDSASGKSGGGGGGSSVRRLGGSILSKARNSALNLTALNIATTVSQKFSSSASVSNLWPMSMANGAGSSSSAAQRKELADFGGDTTTVQPLEYIHQAEFDCYDSNNNTIKPPDSASEHLMNSSSSCNSMSTHNRPQNAEEPAKRQQIAEVQQQSNSRKASTKEKKKHRHKDAERIEKLRLLVSYLRSGTNQQLLKPITLDSEELELAQRYKMHRVLSEDCLRDYEQGSLAMNTCGPKVGCTGDGGLTAPAASETTIARRASTTQPETMSTYYLSGGRYAGGSRTPDHEKASASALASAIVTPESLAGIVINMRRSSDQTTTSSSTSPLQMSAYNAVSGSGSDRWLTGGVCNGDAASTKPLTSSRSDTEMFLSSTPTVRTGSTGAATSSINHSNSTNNHLLSITSNTPTDNSSYYLSSNSSTANNYASCAASVKSSDYLNTMDNSSHHSAADAHDQQTQDNHHHHHSVWAANPQSLATWIDNEVNSLVNDLEAKSQECSRESEHAHGSSNKNKHSTGLGKCKWS